MDEVVKPMYYQILAHEGKLAADLWLQQIVARKRGRDAAERALRLLIEQWPTSRSAAKN